MNRNRFSKQPQISLKDLNESDVHSYSIILEKAEFYKGKNNL